jgi:hypothetical protein
LFFSFFYPQATIVGIIRLEPPLNSNFPFQNIQIFSLPKFLENDLKRERNKNGKLKEKEIRKEKI